MAEANDDELVWLEMDDRAGSLQNGGNVEAQASGGLAVDRATQGGARRRLDYQQGRSPGKAQQTPWTRPGVGDVPLDVHDPKYFPRPNTKPAEARPAERQGRWDIGRGHEEERRGARPEGDRWATPAPRRWGDADARPAARPLAPWVSPGTEPRPVADDKQKDGMWRFQKGAANQHDMWRNKAGNRRDGLVQDAPYDSTSPFAQLEPQRHAPQAGWAKPQHPRHGEDSRVAMPAAVNLHAPLEAAHQGSAPSAHGGARTRYGRQDMDTFLRRMQLESGTTLPLPEDANTAAEVGEVWRHSRAPQGQAQADSLSLPEDLPLAAQALVPPPGMISPRSQRLKEVVAQLAHSALPMPLQMLSDDQYKYLDNESQWQGPFPRESIEAWAKMGYFPEDHRFAAVCSTQDFQFHSLKALWAMQRRLALSAAEIAELLSLQMRLHGPASPTAAGGGWEPVPGPGASFAPSALQHAPSWAPTHHSQAHMQQLAQPMLHEHSAPGSLEGMVTPATGAAHALGDVGPPVSYDPIDAIIDFPADRVGPAASVVRRGAGPQQLQPFASAAGESSEGAAAALMALKHAQPVTQPVTQPAPAALAAAMWPTAAEPRQTPLQQAPQAPAGDLNMLDHLFSPGTAQPTPVALAAQMQQQVQLGTQAVVVHPPPPPPRRQQSQDAADSVLGERKAPFPAWSKPVDHVTPPLTAIQAEQAAQRTESAAHRAQADDRRHARRPGWAAQPPQPQVSMQQIMADDEECAADLEGGSYEEEEDSSIPVLGIPQQQAPCPAPSAPAWQAPGQAPQAASLADIQRQEAQAQPRVAATAPSQRGFWESLADGEGPEAGAGAVSAPRGGTGAAPAWGVRNGAVVQPPPPSRPQQRAEPAAIAKPGKAGTALSGQNKQGLAAREGPQPATDAQLPFEKDLDGQRKLEEDHRILKADPAFKSWCFGQMVALRGTTDLLSVLLYEEANCDVAETANSGLPPTARVGAFVKEFIERRAHAGKPVAKKNRKKVAGGSDAGSANRAPVAAQAAPAPVPGRADDGWALAGSGGKKGKGKKGGGGRGHGVGGSGPAAGGNNMYAMLPLS